MNIWKFGGKSGSLLLAKRHPTNDYLMTIKSFLAEMDPSYFPTENGPWIGFDQHDPQFNVGELRQMAALGIIELEEPSQRYRLTLKALKRRIP